MAKKQQNPESAIASIVKELCEVGISFKEFPHPCPCQRSAPDNNIILDIVDGLRKILLPILSGNEDLSKEQRADHITSTLEQYQPLIKEQIHRALCFVSAENEKNNCNDRAAHSQKISQEFLSTLPSIRKLINTDVQAAYEGDPAAISTDETILCYPGLYAITNYRIAHELYKLDVPLISRMITELAHSKTGIDIHPGARIDESFFIDHGTGVVIGETSIIGKNVRLYQGVTLGAKSFPLDKDGKPIKGIDRHPVVEDDVIIYSETTILGRVTIGKGSIIGGNVWLTHNVPPKSRVLQAKTQQELFSGGSGI